MPESLNQQNVLEMSGELNVAIFIYICGRRALPTFLISVENAALTLIHEVYGLL
jgi:hypothetical protein